ncbi:hypothetical protein IE077_001066 [Cardiosporidium cionae]|uniref:Thioesterase domain-containing protein n=1 Tax=Cardiosporidium cionae TaxID=476202 RepID=A0ABQ7J6T4_9APIC|nr:hypothetical protein IE077_001066 [Cardiosporidium cionae]|eukprot:KAF8819400.1 hypothetical protein IE077_001066 [Cardiosporidium cionae]
MFPACRFWISPLLLASLCGTVSFNSYPEIAICQFSPLPNPNVSSQPANSEDGNIPTTDSRIASNLVKPSIHSTRKKENDRHVEALPAWTHVHFTRPSYHECSYKGYANDLQSNPTGYAHFVHDLLCQEHGIQNPQYFLDKDHTHVILLCGLGKGICGHKGIIHGGLTATIVDNALAILAFASCNCGVATKSLSIQYRRPILAGENILVSAEIAVANSTTKNYHLRALIYGEDGKLRASADGIFVPVGEKWKHLIQSTNSFINGNNTCPQ